MFSWQWFGTVMAFGKFTNLLYLLYQAMFFLLPSVTETPFG
jgi:hypothetical protein